jgi:hypothetical protein
MKFVSLYSQQFFSPFVLVFYMYKHTCIRSRILSSIL